MYFREGGEGERCGGDPREDFPHWDEKDRRASLAGRGDTGHGIGVAEDGVLRVQRSMASHSCIGVNTSGGALVVHSARARLLKLVVLCLSSRRQRQRATGGTFEKTGQASSNRTPYWLNAPGGQHERHESRS